jgi:hypothetical protein
VLGGWAPPVGAAPPLLDFDVPFSIGCRSLHVGSADKANVAGDFWDILQELTSPAHGLQSVPADEDSIEVVIPISAQMRAGSERDLKQCLYTLIDTSQPETFTVMDWLPRTQLQTEYAKPIQVNQQRDANIGITLSAKYIVTANGQAGGQLKSGITYEMLPPQEIVLASGTVQHAHGVFFRLKPSSQTTMEGVRSFSAIFQVPRGWRGGCLQLECEAVGVDRGIVRPLDQEMSAGRARYCLALYRAGDQEAEKLANRVGQCQRDLLDSMAQHRQEVSAIWYKAFSWQKLRRGPALFDRSSSLADNMPGPVELSLLASVLDREVTTHPSMDEFPSNVRDKMRALQTAVQDLESLPVLPPPLEGHATSGSATSSHIQLSAYIPLPDLLGGPAGKSPKPVPASTSLGEPQHSDRPADAGKSSLRSTDSNAVLKTPEPAARTGGADLQRPAALERKAESNPPSAVSLVQAKTDPTKTPPSSSVTETNLPSVTEHEAQRATRAMPLTEGGSKGWWYLLAAMWGGVFAYNIAAWIAEHFRKNREASHSHHPKSRHARARVRHSPPEHHCNV